MKCFFKIAILFFILTSCKDAIKNESKILAQENFEDIQFAEPKVTNSLIVTERHDLLGYWIGNFEASLSQEQSDSIYKNEEYNPDVQFKITFSIDKIKGDSIYGHSISAGNITSFKGLLSDNALGFEFDVEESKDEKTLGNYSAQISLNDSIMKGYWISDSSNEVKFSSWKFDLKKKLFVYDKNNKLYINFYNTNKLKKITVTDTIDENEIRVYEDEEYFATTEKVMQKNASYDLLTPEFVSNLSKADIFILRNSIFARHGFAFRDKQLRRYFEDYDWYMPVFGDIKGKLSELEKENINLLIRYEKNAEEYYDTFGR
ncbi:MAG: YARHG domain-containing protein [Bacteroidota bacterium]